MSVANSSLRAGIDLDMPTLMRMRQNARSWKKDAIASHHSVGAITGKQRGSGVDLHDLRAYQQGDDFRHIDASASARTGRPHIKTYLEERDHTGLILVDFRQSMFWGTSGALRSFAAAHFAVGDAWDIFERGGRVSLLILMDHDLHYVAAQDGLSGMMRLMEEICHFYQMELASSAGDDRITLERALRFVREVSERNASIHAFTGLDHAGDHFREALLALKKRQMQFVVVQDALETSDYERPLPVSADADADDVAWLQFKETPSSKALDVLKTSHTSFRLVKAAEALS